MGKLSVIPNNHSSTLGRQSHPTKATQNFGADVAPVPNGLTPSRVGKVRWFGKLYTHLIADSLLILCAKIYQNTL